MLSVNTNTAASKSSNSLRTNRSRLSKSVARLSSGARINGASDDAAGLSITNRMNAQVLGQQESARNAQDWISLFQTAEGATQEMTNMLQRMREISVQAANETYNDNDRASLQAELDQLLNEIDRIGQGTKFNDIKVLDGDLLDSLMQIGPNSDSGERVSFSSVNTQTLGRQARVLAEFSVLTDLGLSAADDAQIQINGHVIRDTAAGDDQLSTSFNANSAIAKAAAINSVSDKTGVTAHVGPTILEDFDNNEILGGTLDENIFITINGEKISGFVVEENDANGQLRDAINAVSERTGVVASLDVDSELVLRAEDGRNIELLASDPDAENIIGLAEDVYGGHISISSNATIDITYLGDNTNDSLGELDSNAPLGGDARVYGVNSEFALNSIDVTTQENATLSMEIIDLSLENVSAIRADFGALQNRLLSTVNNLQQTTENLTQAKSRIEDADFASETSKLASEQIIQQAATSILAQANQSLSIALELIQ